MIARTAAVALLALFALIATWPAPLPGTASEAQQPADGRYPSTDIPAATSGEHRPTVSVGKPDPAAVLRPTPRPGELGTLSPAASPSSRRTRGAVTLDGRRTVRTARNGPKTAHSAPKRLTAAIRATGRVDPKYGVPWLTASGIASHMGYGFPAGYLALPHGPGWHARICGAGGCVTMTSNDAGPALYLQRQGRIADLSVRTFEKVCGVPASRGLCPVTVSILGRAR